MTTARTLWTMARGPAAVWLALLVLLAVTCGVAFVPLGAATTALNLAIAAGMLALLGTFLMDLMNASVLLRIAAASGLLWTLFMFTLTFADYFSRG